MIIKQKVQNVHNIQESNITELTVESNIAAFIAFCKFVSLKKVLQNCCKSKAQGFSVFEIFKVLFFTVFQLRNFWQLSISNNFLIPFASDTVYRFLNSPYHRWRTFLAQISKTAVRFCCTLTSNDKRKVFVVDDSVYNKNRSKKLELLSRVYDHVDKIYVKGFRFLTLAFTDGISLIPIDSALLGTKKIVCEANPDIDKRSSGFKRRLEAVCEAPSVLLSMIDNASDLICEGSYIVFDSWFCVLSLIREIVNRKLHVTGWRFRFAKSVCTEK